jgi:Chitobiase/beta-hexosaminidase C-terminal domain
MSKIITFLLLSMGLPALATTYTIPAGSNSATIQAALNGAVAGSTIVFAAGTYNISSPLSIPCTLNLTVTGPVSSPATAILTADFTNNVIFDMGGCTGITIEYLHFENTGGIYVTSPASGITITHNQFSGLIGNENQFADMGIYFDGNAGGTLSNTTITWNTFGSPTDCAGVMVSQTTDQGGVCAGMLFQTNMDGVTIEDNSFLHLEEGFHVLCNGACEPPAGFTWSNFTAQFNDFNQIHRIAMEMQPQASANVSIQYNSYENPLNPFFGTMGISSACCNTGATEPGTIDSNNVLIANNPSVAGNYIAYTIEFWGNGAQANNNLIQGYWANGIVWGLGGGDWEILNNNICGPYMNGGQGSYIADEESDPDVPTITGNVTSTSCSAVASTTPVISPTTGSVSFPRTIKMSDAGSNTSIYYTTDGSAPVPGAGTTRLYAGSLSMTAAGTVKAVGMWGSGANPLSYPAGYGYVPSKVVSASVSGAATVAPAATLVSAYLGSKGNANTMVTGGTLQFTAYGVYSDGSVAAMPDSQGHTVNLWNTSNHSVAKMSTLGHATATGVGTASVVATIGTIKSNVWTVTVRAPSVAPAAHASAPAAEAAGAAMAEAAVSPAVEAAPSAPVYGAIPESPGGALGDSFLGPFWKLSTPAGGSASISNGHLFLGVPGGGNHDALLPSNQAVQVMQQIGSENFDVSIKIDSAVVATDASTSQGLMALSDSKNFVTFAISTDGTKIGLSAHTVTGGVGTTVLDDTDFSQYQNPMYLRLSKTGSNYVAYFSVDGVNWVQAGGFTDSLALTSIGPFASNYNATPANTVPVVMAVNWFDIQ